MKFKTAKDTFRYYAVGGFDSEEQMESVLKNVIDELGVDAFEEYELEIMPEVERGLFLSPPPVIIG